MIFLSSCVFIYSLLLTPSIDSKWIHPSWKKMIPVRGYVQLNNRVFNLSEPLQVPHNIAKKLVSKISQTLSVDQVPVLSTPIEPAAQSPVVEPAAQSPVVEPAAQSPVVEPAAQAPVVEPAAQAPVVEPAAQAPVVTPSVEPQEPASESSSELAQSPALEVSSTTTTTTTTTTTPAPTTPSTTTTTSTVAPRVVPVAPVKTYVAPSKTHSVQSEVFKEEAVKAPTKTHSVQSEVYKEEAVKAPTKTSVKSPSKSSPSKANPTKTSNYPTKQVVQSPYRYASPAKTARVISQTNY